MKTKITDIQFDKFIRQIQLAKMKELWDNKEDEYWEIKQIDSIT